ncbi:hypothetical protein FPV67DRAFT_1447308 [Lyophyllum atratum]|nr:hypothetical protein FPV67DRAFT_1447308 [Lyophyllum atratum]
MRQRGIHDVFHASLLRIHKPNDDRLFPGRLDTQIVETTEHEGEWAADKIVAHRGTKTSAMFEVLWKAGDKTWMPHSQVVELHLLDPYLEALGLESISELEEGFGEPPQGDPQVFLGHLQLPLSINDEVASPFPHLPSLSSPFVTVSSLSLHGMAPQNNNKPPRHPGISIDTDSKCIIIKHAKTGYRYEIHPLHLARLVKFNEAVHEDEDYRMALPVGYHDFAECFNSANFLYKVCEYNCQGKKWNIPHIRLPSHILPTAFFDSRYLPLVGLSLIDRRSGDVDERAFQDFVQALRRPHGENARKSAQYHRRKEETQNQQHQNRGRKRQYQYERDQFLSDTYSDEEPEEQFYQRPAKRRQRHPSSSRDNAVAGPSRSVSKPPPPVVSGPGSAGDRGETPYSPNAVIESLSDREARKAKEGSDSKGKGKAKEPSGSDDQPMEE